MDRYYRVQNQVRGLRAQPGLCLDSLYIPIKPVKAKLKQGVAPRSGAGPFSHPPAPLCSIGASLGSGEGHITPEPVSRAGL